VNNFEFGTNFICEYFIFKLQMSNSVASVLSSRSALTFYWNLYSREPCPLQNKFVSTFLTVMQHKHKKLPRKAYPISYKEVSLLIQHTMVGVSLENFSFVKLHFVTFLVTLYSSFARYEEVIKLNISDMLQEETGFVLHFKKGKTYQWGESHIGVVSDLPLLDFNPARIFSIYLDRVALLHSNASHNCDLLFFSCRVSFRNELSLDRPVSYSNLKTEFKLSVAACELEVGLNKVGLHCLRRGGVTHAVRAGANHDVVQKAMRVKTRSIVS
jgi:integrase